MYEVSTETLFLGRQDAMQRQALVPLAEFMRGRAARGAGTQLLELACGTGRFASFIKARPDRARHRSAGSAPSFVLVAHQGGQAHGNAVWRGPGQLCYPRLCLPPGRQCAVAGSGL